MPRTRVHNMFVSLDGYAAGEDVTLDAPIGGAAALFGWFDGRVIYGVDRVDEPVTVDRALYSIASGGDVLHIASGGDVLHADEHRRRADEPERNGFEHASHALKSGLCKACT